MRAVSDGYPLINLILGNYSANLTASSEQGLPFTFKLINFRSLRYSIESRSSILFLPISNILSFDNTLIESGMIYIKLSFILTSSISKFFVIPSIL